MCFLSEPFNLEECQKQLRSIYDTMNKVKVIPWDQSSAVHIDEIFTQLSWLMDDRKPSGVTQEKLKDYTEIFKGRKHYPKPKRVLVYGRPGIGKTVFAQKTTFDWSKQKKELLRKFELVLLIKLRDVCDLQDIRAVLRASKLLARDGMISVDSLYDYILQNQEKVLLILDGYDEYSADKISPIRDIWERKQLRDCCVVMTTRRLKVDELRRPSDVQFEIKGFDSWSQVWKFARKLLKDDWDVKEFIEYLKEQNLKELAEIPLILLMLCLLWKERDRRGQPNSRADIYTQFIQTLLDHMTEKDADSKQFRKVDEYTEQLFKLGQFAFEALLQDSLFLHLSKLSDDILIEKLTRVGLLQVLNLSSLNPEKGVFFIHKSVQEFLAGRYLKDELLAKKSGNAACLSNVDTIEKVLKMTEVLKFACELSGEAANVVLSHVGLVSKKEGLTEYNFMRTPSLHDLSEEQRHFLTLSTHLFFCCSSSMRQDLFSVFASDLGGVLLLDSKQLHGIANEHLFIESTEVPNYIFFSDSKSPVQDYCDLISVVEDLNAIVVTCSGEMKASKFLKKYPVRPVNEIFLKKDDKVNLYFAQILRGMHEYSEPLYLSTEILKELIASPESTQKMKKRVGDQPNEQDSRTSLCFTENKNSTSCSSRHCLSLVWNITVYHVEGEVMETLTEVLPFVASPRKITIYGKADEAYDAQTIETLVSRINFTDRLDTLDLYRISLTAKSATVVARSLYHAPNLRKLDLSFNPVGEGVSVLARHLSCTPHLERLYLDYVKMAKKQVHDLTVAVRHTNISVLVSEYHVSCCCCFFSCLCCERVWLHRHSLVYLYSLACRFLLFLHISPDSRF